MVFDDEIYIGNCLFMRKMVVSLASCILINASYAVEVDYQSIVNQAYTKFKTDNRGKIADYIPALAKYNPNSYGIVLITIDGKIYSAGDIRTLFPLESLSKVFMLALALEQYDADEVLNKIGANATGLHFNSVTAVEQQSNHTGNALVNAGAMATVSMIKGRTVEQKWQLILNYFSSYDNDYKLTMNQEVYKSEMATNQHNHGIAKLLQSYNHFYSDPEDAIDLYTRACSINVSTVDLAKMGVVLANKGQSPFNHKQILQESLVPNVLAEMSTAGMYETSGNWLYTVGLPAKSGVSGGVIAIAPGKFAIAVYSPPLDEAGNSVRGQDAIKYIAKATKANIFSPD